MSELFTAQVYDKALRDTVKALASERRLADRLHGLITRRYVIIEKSPEFNRVMLAYARSRRSAAKEGKKC